ncbi:peptide ABC transporter substrate-binding protein [Achromobacter piechaudii]|uniref:ABC transporter substrate-binding protein n=1 Tax=Achromobacter piechaudii TaxID=72556 RepID=UPI0006832BBF|nr:ABC transporter substrate-binding protein [Achromobacter piechaudii]KNY08925.1 peptide ABC transporter substrate-binding protein [Achromobacter piechaudii]
MQFLRTTFTATALTLALGGALPAVFSTAHAAGTLSVAINQDPGSWDPIDTFVTFWGSVGGNLYDGLTMRGADLKLQPGLATSWEYLDDNKRLRFKLREGVKFHNGEPFNAEAVKFTFDRLLGAEGAKGPQKSNYDSIGEIKVVDDYTVDFILKQPDPVLLTKLAGYGAMIVPPKYIKEKGEDYFNTNPVGTGPFKFESYQPKVNVTLARNDEYWGGKPKLDKVVYRFISEPGTQVAELQAGRVDIATLIPLGLIETVKKSGNADVISTGGPVAFALRYNTKGGITQNRDVRRALIMAVDREAIVKQLLLGQAKVIASFQGPQSFGYNSEQKPLPFNPAEAKKLLAAAGVKPGATVQIDVRGSDSNFREVAQAVSGYLQGVGVRATIKPYETGVLLNDIIPGGKTGEMWQNQWGGWTYDYDNTAYLMYHSGQKWNPYDNDAKLNGMLEAQRTVYDVKKREAMLQEIATYVADQALEMPLYSLNTIVGVNKRVKNLEVPGDIRFRFLETSVE